MNKRIRLPDHYEARTIGTMGADEFAYIPSHALSADYLTRNLFVDTQFGLNPRDNGEIDPVTMDSDYFTRQKLMEHVGILSVFLATGRVYVADLRNLQINDIYWNEIEEATEEPDRKLYPFSNLDMQDYNAFVKHNIRFKPLAAAALRGVSGDVEFHGLGDALEAVQYLCEENDYLTEVLELHMENDRYDLDISDFDDEPEQEQDEADTETLESSDKIEKHSDWYDGA